MGNYEEETDANGNVRKIHYLSGGAMLVQSGNTETLYYGYSDFQGSLIALTDANGNVVEKYAYDPWGARRNADDWTQKDLRTSWITNRGYTGHEHIDAFGIINMNGRVYDPATGMFLSPDPYVQSPKDWLNYNRYSYCMGNPFKYTDPSGNFWLFRVIFGAVGLLGDILTMPIRVVVTVVGLISGDQGVWRNVWSGYGEFKWGCVDGWNSGTQIDRSIFGKPDGDKDVVTGIAGAGSSLLYSSDGYQYRKFNSLQEMTQYMYDTSNNPACNVEISGYVLTDELGVEYYYVLDWSGNTQTKSYSRYTPTKNGPMYDGKKIIASIHTHPASYYKDNNRVNAYDGPSWDDYQAAKELGVPVYSIGPVGVSVVTGQSEYNNEEYYKGRAALNYTDAINSGNTVTLGNGSGTRDLKDVTFRERKNINPFYIESTSTWLQHPYLISKPVVPHLWN